MLTFILQNSLTLTSIFTVGHIGKVELGAVSLGGMTATITGYAVYQGLATSLDTLCAQAYGSGRRKLVGLQLQRMVFFLWAITIPIAIIWACATPILELIVPEQEIADLSGQYLRVLIIGAPAYACFESGKRYVQAQGRFEATLYVLLITAPLNAFLHWLFVWRFNWGFIGCPIAVVITECLMPILLLLYVRFIAPNGMECWPGLTSQALRNWGPMIRLALPGLVMVLAEFLAFEILTLASARISATHLAANTVLQSLSILTYQLPFPLSIAASTRTANLIGASLPDAAKITTQVAFISGTIIGLFNMILLSSLRFQIPWLFTSEADVVALAAATLPINAAFQLFDALAAICNGALRGLGKQEVGGYINLFAYYVVSCFFSLFIFPRSTNVPGHSFWKGLIADAILLRLHFLSHSVWRSACIGISPGCGRDPSSVWPLSPSSRGFSSIGRRLQRPARRLRCETRRREGKVCSFSMGADNLACNDDG
jgi:MATE family multidrug resistance protein